MEEQSPKFVLYFTIGTYVGQQLGEYTCSCIPSRDELFCIYEIYMIYNQYNNKRKKTPKKQSVNVNTMSG